MKTNIPSTTISITISNTINNVYLSAQTQLVMWWFTCYSIILQFSLFFVQWSTMIWIICADIFLKLTLAILFCISSYFELHLLQWFSKYLVQAHSLLGFNIYCDSISCEISNGIFYCYIKCQDMSLVKECLFNKF